MYISGTLCPVFIDTKHMSVVSLNAWQANPWVHLVSLLFIIHAELTMFYYIHLKDEIWIYRKVSDISGTKSQNLNAYRLVW